MNKIYTHKYESGKYEEHRNAPSDNEVRKYSERTNIPMDEARHSIEGFIVMLNKRIDDRNTVTSKEYLDWLYSYIKDDRTYDDETAMYKVKDEKDRKNLCQLSYLQKVIEDLSENNNIENITDKENEFEILNYNFKYRDKTFNISTMIGQGAITFIEIAKDTNRDYIELMPE